MSVLCVCESIVCGENAWINKDNRENQLIFTTPSHINFNKEHATFIVFNKLLSLLKELSVISINDKRMNLQNTFVFWTFESASLIQQLIRAEW